MRGADNIGAAGYGGRGPLCKEAGLSIGCKSDAELIVFGGDHAGTKERRRVQEGRCVFGVRDRWLLRCCDRRPKHCGQQAAGDGFGQHGCKSSLLPIYSLAMRVREGIPAAEISPAEWLPLVTNDLTRVADQRRPGHLFS